MTHEGGALSPPSVILAEIKIHQAYVLTCRDLLEERSLPAPGRCRIFKHIRNAELFTDTEKSATEVEQAVAILQLATIMCPKPSEAHGTSVAAQRRRTNTVIFLAILKVSHGIPIHTNAKCPFRSNCKICPSTSSWSTSSDACSPMSMAYAASPTSLRADVSLPLPAKTSKQLPLGAWRHSCHKGLNG